jgi:hypothetical protein
MSRASQGALIVMGMVTFIGVVIGISLYSWFQTQFVTGEEIRMVQPNGIFPDLDAHYAQEVNVPNSEANLNNGLGRIANAQATAIVNTTNNETGRTYMAGALNGLGMGIICLLSLLGPVILLLLVSLSNKQTS